MIASRAGASVPVCTFVLFPLGVTAPALTDIYVMLFGPHRSKEAQVHALKQEGARLGLRPPDPPTAEGGTGREIPSEPA